MNEEMNVINQQTTAAEAPKIEPFTAQEQPRIEINDLPTTVPSNNSAKRTMLFRHPTDKMVGGVCGGLAEYTGIDPVLMRIFWVIATLVTGGGGFMAYLALWLLLPVGTATKGQMQPAAVELNERNLSRAAILLMGLGGLWLLSNIGVLPWLWLTFAGVIRAFFWPVLLIGAGYLLLTQSGKEINFGSWRKTNMNNINMPNMNMDDLRSRFNEERSKISERVDMRGAMNNLRQNFPFKRSNRDRIFMGVCGGIGQKLGIDSNLVRLIWTALTIGSIGTGVVVYVVAGLLLPKESETAPVPTIQEPVDVQIIDGSATRMV